MKNRSSYQEERRSLLKEISEDQIDMLKPSGGEFGCISDGLPCNILWGLPCCSGICRHYLYHSNCGWFGFNCCFCTSY